MLDGGIGTARWGQGACRSRSKSKIKRRIGGRGGGDPGRNRVRLSRGLAFSHVVVEVGADGAGSGFEAHGVIEGAEDTVLRFFDAGNFGCGLNLGGGFVGAEIVVFAQAEGFAVEAGERVEKADEVRRVRLERAVSQCAEDFGEAELDKDFLKLM